MIAHIIYERYYDFEKKEIPAGGIQTYLSNLIPIIKECNYDCVVYQAGKRDQQIVINGIVINSIVVPSANNWIKNTKVILKKVKENYNNDTDFLLFATDCMIVKNNVRRSIAIQHGICWDIPTHLNFKSSLNALYSIKKGLVGYEIIKRLGYVKEVVCVDYNFPNWYRAVSAHEAIPLNVVPNFTKIAPVFVKPSGSINVIFARRFEKYRGTRLFIDAILPLLQKYDNVNITIAGRGPEEQYMRQILKKFGKKVSFLQYEAGQSLEIHADKHIAVVPTIGSEGTSLSLLEAMSAQCAVICTNVGGMTNIVINEYNGLMINANSKELEIALTKLIEDKALREKLANRGYETVKEAFSYTKWANQWKLLIQHL